ncbi:2-phospho-L-lactate transferase CofD family protein [Nonomuraea sp. NPDC049486]|uniref:2-phospho-L-lactate transferase CofD family protein n=1 Tax=Nonomuraea sp. NPDC049486 TaxID=3155773 RepID=UPI00343DE561
MSGRTAVTLFSGGRGGAGIARGLLRTPGVDLTLVINGYDNGRSTGALRRYLPGMLGPSDFRKNLLVHLDDRDPRQAALRSVLEHRLTAGAEELAALAHAISSPSSPARTADAPDPVALRSVLEHRLTAGKEELADTIGGPASPSTRTTNAPDPAALPPSARTASALDPAALSPQARAAIGRDLAAFLRWVDSHPDGLDLTECALGNLVFAGAYLRLGEDFNAAVRACARTFESPLGLVNVTGGENAFLVALKQDGRLLADEADIVAPQDAAAITDLFLLREPLTFERRAELAARPVQEVRRILADLRATVSLNPEAGDAIRNADLLLYGPGTPHSSLLPSYLTPGVADAIAESRAAAKVFVVNTRDDHDVQGLSAPELVGRTLAYLGDPGNERGTVTHVLSHRAPDAPGVPSDVVAGGVWAGARWVTADLADADRPGVHCGPRTVRALMEIADEAALTRTP